MNRGKVEIQNQDSHFSTVQNRLRRKEKNRRLHKTLDAPKLLASGNPIGGIMKALFLSLALTAVALHAQDLREGMWQGFDGEWVHVSRQVIVLAEATPAEKFTWRPAAGVRSMSEVYMHIALTNFDLLSVIGPKMPADITPDDMEKTVTTKADVIVWLKRSIEAVKTAHAAVKPADLRRKVKVDNHTATVDSVYLRIIIHANEHMGQLVAYARMNGIVPPWSKSAKR